MKFRYCIIIMLISFLNLTSCTHMNEKKKDRELLIFYLTKDGIVSINNGDPFPLADVCKSLEQSGVDKGVRYTLRGDKDVGLFIVKELVSKLMDCGYTNITFIDMIEDTKLNPSANYKDDNKLSINNGR